MTIEARMRGQPIMALALVLAGWVGARGYAWERALSDAGEAAAHLVAGPAAAPEPAPAAARRHSRATASPGKPHAAPPAPMLFAAPGSLPLTLPAAVVVTAPVTVAVADPLAPPPPVAPTPPAGTANEGETLRRIYGAAGHQSLWLAATALMPLPPMGLREPAAARPASRPSVLHAPRWSGDSWLLLRRNPAAAIAPGPVPGTYGASQAGAVIRYRLVPASGHKPAIYARAAAALGTVRQQEVALGLSARPVPAIPLVAMAEARVTRSGSATQVRPAAALVTELPPQALAFGFVGEAYGQGGYVGGRGGTPFIDGLVRAERPIISAGKFSLKAGAGAWAAAQRGASRVDVGPVASVAVRLTDTASARIEADWRFRVGGRAKPDSGPALTVSAGF